MANHRPITQRSSFHKTPIRTEPKKSLIPALICLFLSVSLGAAGIAFFSRRATKDFYVQARCTGLQFAAGFTIYPDPLVDLFHLVNFRGSVQHINEILVPNAVPRFVPADVEIQFQPDLSNPTGAPPSLRLTRSGTPAPARIEAHRIISLQCLPRSGTEDQIDLTVGSGSTLTAQAKQYAIEAARYSNVLFPYHPVNGNSATFVAANSTAFIQGVFETPADANDEDGTISLLFPKNTDRVSLLAHSDSVLNLGSLDLSLSGCISSLFEIRDSANVTFRDDTHDFKVSSDAFKLTRLFVTPPDDHGTRLFEMRGEGAAHSILQEQKQLLPTVLADTLSRKPYEVGLTGAAILLCIFAGGIFLKRSLEVLAKRCIPE